MIFEWLLGPKEVKPLVEEIKKEKNSLEGRRLRYLIGANTLLSTYDDSASIVEVPYDAEPILNNLSIGYCNLFDETNSGFYGPYLHTSDTAKEYNEGMIDPNGPGWFNNLYRQFALRRKQGFLYIELDNPDAYFFAPISTAITLADAVYGLKVIAKNAFLTTQPVEYLAHSNVYGCIVEKDAGDPFIMDELRRKAGKPNLPIWFVFFGNGREKAKQYALDCKHYKNMFVTYSQKEYNESIDVDK